MADKTVFIVSEDPTVRDSLSKLVAAAGLRAEALPSIEVWFRTAAPEFPDCLVLDTSADSLVGPERLAEFARACARMPVLVLVHRGAVQTAVHALKHGAVDVMQKPLQAEILLERIRKVIAGEGEEDAVH
ncbi:MAG TPA: response regulator [Candidatus Competibacteraceae bacterium]|nr:response regulator [Candidatus Competibacteraceae bacterium]MCP5133163.1 response regulator [Gammaproteobacteria bacterium]HPF57910.1 response regulator [Candidatus Competibacteraceae bacterium]